MTTIKYGIISILFILLLFSENIFAQKELGIFKSNTYNQFVEKLANSFLEKSNSLNINKWYEGNSKNKVRNKLKELKFELTNANKKINYAITINSRTLIYHILFLDDDFEGKLGQISIFFTNKNNFLADDIKIYTISDFKDSHGDNLNYKKPPPLPWQ